MIEIFVEKVSADRNMVALRAANVRFIFVRKLNGSIRLLSKSKPEAQVHDPDACWVPKNMFDAAYQKAATILKIR